MAARVRLSAFTPGSPSQRSTSPASGVALPPAKPMFLANTTDAGTGKKVFGSSFSRSHALLQPKSTDRVRVPLRALHLPVRHLECWPA